MKLVYTITLYKNPEQFAWMWQAICNDHDTYIIHIDQKTPNEIYKGFRQIVGERENVFWQKRQSIVWMGPGLVDVEMDAIKEALTRASDFDYLINLSGQDFPLRHRADIVAELQKHKGRNFISAEPLSQLPFHVRRRPHLLTFEVGGRLFKTPLVRPIPKDLSISWKGSWWHILSSEFCRWIVASRRAKAYQRFLRNVQAPDELFFQNVVMDSPFSETVADRNRTFVKWTGQGGSPDILGMAQLDELSRSSMFFARKFDRLVDQEILEHLATKIGMRSFA